MSAQDALARRWLTGTLVATLAFRAWLSVVVPFTGDEAYFLVWGQQPDIGYYDHPPMVGWLLVRSRPRRGRPRRGPGAAGADECLERPDHH